MIQEAKDRTTYQSWTSRHGRPELVTRRASSPIQIHTVVWHPAVSDWIADQVAKGLDPKPALREMLARYLPVMEQLFAGQRHLLALAVHTDTDDPHLDIVVSRQGPKGRIGRAGLRAVGPWIVGVDRQLRAGAQVSPEKLAQYQRAKANFTRRYGEGAKPFDIVLTRAFDAAAEAVLGGQLPPYLAAYAAHVPELERAHLAAALAELDEARAQLMAALSPPPSPSPGIDPRP